MFFIHEELIGNSQEQIQIAYKLDANAPSAFHNSNLLNPRSLSFLGIADSSPETNRMYKPDKALLGRLQGASKLAIRIVDPYDNNQLTTNFTLEELRKEILKLSCVPAYF